MELLVVNPNTTAAVTALLARRVRAMAPASAIVHAASARFGAAYIADEASFAVAGHAVLDAWTTHRLDHAAPDAVLVGCFGDPGVFAVREASSRPVVGLAEAAMREAAVHGRFAIVTGGAAWKPMLARLARVLELDGALAGIHIVAPTGAELAADPEAAKLLLAAACRQAAIGADCVVLGGAALAGMAEALAPALDVPLIDSVDAGVRALLSAALLSAALPKRLRSGT